MESFKIVVFIMAILISLTAIANKRKLPYPVLLVLAGLVIGFVPHLPNLALDPDIVFVIILPPLLYDAASRTSWHEFRTSIRPIAALAITLVFFTTVSVAVTAHYLIPGFEWALAFILGAVVSPPDAVAASGIIKGLGLNKQVITILEGESLVNDASALIAYRSAVAAVTTGTFVFWKAGLQFLLVAGMGILIGVLVGYVFVLAYKKIRNNPVVETSFTLLSPFISYLTAEQFHMSGVLAVVSTGLLIAWRAPEVFSFRTRMQARVVWDILVFLLQGFVFIMIGLQLPSIIADLSNYSFMEMLGYGLLISLVTITVRVIWVFAGAWWMNYMKKGRKEMVEGQNDHWKNVLVVAWTGTRGVISLAAALALPLVLDDGSAFPKRHSIIFLSFVVIFMTLVVQGLSLPLLVRLLKIKPQKDAGSEDRELQLLLATATLEFIAQEYPSNKPDKTRDLLKSNYQLLVLQLTKEIRIIKKTGEEPVEGNDQQQDALLKERLKINHFQRDLLLHLHKEGEFSDDALRKAEREMDINELKLSLGDP